MDLKKNIIGLKASATLAINELSQKLITEGKEVFKFGLGQSPFPVPDIIVKELQKNGISRAEEIQNDTNFFQKFGYGLRDGLRTSKFCPRIAHF